MNSSVLNDPIFVKEIEEVFQGLQDMHITDPLEWWDLFIMVVQGTTMAYTKRKAKIKHGLKRFLTVKLETYENRTFRHCHHGFYDLGRQHPARPKGVLSRLSAACDWTRRAC